MTVKVKGVLCLEGDLTVVGEGGLTVKGQGCFFSVYVLQWCTWCPFLDLTILLQFMHVGVTGRRVF